MFHLGSAPRRAPFSDWLSQVNRFAERAGYPLVIVRSDYMQSCYDVGLSPSEVADDIVRNR